MERKRESGKAMFMVRWGGIGALAAGVGLIALHLVLPAGLPTLFLSPEEVLEGRARGLMDSLVAKDWAAAGDFVRNSEWVRNQPSVSHQLESYEIRGIEVEEDTATVQVQIHYRLSVPRVPQLSMIEQDAVLSQKWKKNRYQWYLEVGDAPTSFYDLLRGIQDSLEGDRG